ncbi:hypothetical protein MUK42_37077 [Musa troglodytarum]|uniref:Uncharacterized protein n=1 Tax=Musa troglodytarum TaxID=320322 RepID=A0A9E7K9F8_9LILI|nr:hypothetical protein MUK42_37077 [Musa troglodytarum]
MGVQSSSSDTGGRPSLKGVQSRPKMAEAKNMIGAAPQARFQESNMAETKEETEEERGCHAHLIFYRSPVVCCFGLVLICPNKSAGGVAE